MVLTILSEADTYNDPSACRVVKYEHSEMRVKIAKSGAISSFAAYLGQLQPRQKNEGDFPRTASFETLLFAHVLRRKEGAGGC